jgi:hypothetical protein
MRVEDDLEDSAAKYADHAESTILKLQQAYLKKYHPRQYARSNDVSQRPEDAPNRRLGGKVVALYRGRPEDLQGLGLEPAKSEEGIANITRGFRLGLLNFPPELVSDDNCRRAVSLLNTLRLKRVESLEDGYNVSVML